MNHRISSAILGSADGVSSVAGVIAGGTGATVGHPQLGATALGYALAGCISMAGGEWLSEGRTDWSAVAAMATGSFLGAALPALPLLLVSGTAAMVVVIIVSLLVAGIVGEVRARATDQSRLSAIGRSLLVLVGGGVVGYAAGRLT